MQNWLDGVEKPNIKEWSDELSGETCAEYKTGTGESGRWGQEKWTDGTRNTEEQKDKWKTQVSKTNKQTNNK